MDIAEPSPSGAADVSQQLHAIARLLGIKEQKSQQAGQLIDTINKTVASRMSDLPQAFHEAVLPEGALSERQARPMQPSYQCQLLQWCWDKQDTTYTDVLPKPRQKMATCMDYDPVAMLSACK